MDILVYTDGSCIKNKQSKPCGGYGIHFPNKEYDDVSKKFLLKPITNQRAELYAVLQAIRTVQKHSFKSLVIHTDSKYTINSVTVWVNQWIKNGWLASNKKPVKNQDIIKKIYALLNKHKGKITFKHVFAHTGKKDYDSVCNDVADKLAVGGSKIQIKYNSITV